MSVWKSDETLLSICILNFSFKFVKNTPLPVVFSTLFSVFHLVMKHCISCLIYYMKHLEVRRKYSAARRIFNSLLGVSSGDETLHLMFDILHEKRFFKTKDSEVFLQTDQYNSRFNFIQRLKTLKAFELT